MTTPARSERPLTLTVAMIVRDAGDVLCDTLDSFRAIADEFVVLDTGSTDDTVRLAREAGASVFEFRWCDDFAAARNECARHVSGEWTLWVDAGETIDDVAAAQLRQFVEDQASLAKAYVLYVQKPRAAGDCSTEQIGQLRLLPTSARLTFLGRVRETALPAAIAAGLEIDALDCRIARPSTDLDPRVRRQKARRDLRLAELSIDESGDSAAMINVKAQALVELGRGHEACPLFRRAIESAPPGSTEMLEAYYGLLSYLDDQEAQRDERFATCLEALDVFPLDAQLLCGMGCYLLLEGRLELAARSYELAAAHGQLDPAMWHLSDLADVAVACHSLLCQLLGRDLEARRALESALELRPDSWPLRRQLVDLYIKAGQEQSALEQLDELPEMSHRTELMEVVRGAILVAAGNVQTGLTRLESAYRRGCRDPLCFRWLAAAYLQANNRAAAEQLLDQWQEREPAAVEIIRFRRALNQPQHPAADDGGRTGGGTPERKAPVRPPHMSTGPIEAAPWVPPAMV